MLQKKIHKNSTESYSKIPKIIVSNSHTSNFTKSKNPSRNQYKLYKLFKLPLGEKECQKEQFFSVTCLGCTPNLRKDTEWELLLQKSVSHAQRLRQFSDTGSKDTCNSQKRTSNMTWKHSQTDI